MGRGFRGTRWSSSLPALKCWCPKGWGMLRGDVQASERRSAKPLGGGVKPPRDAGKPALSKGGEEAVLSSLHTTFRS
jgi:hypothetical protein